MKKRGVVERSGRTFGADAEDYISRLFDMLKNPQGDRRPDLVSWNGRYSLPFSIEVKSGVDACVKVPLYQLHYGISSFEDYETLFGRRPVKREGFLPGMPDDSKLNESAVAYYYLLLDRDDSLTSQDVRMPWSNIQIRWKDGILIPHELGLHYFAVRSALKTGRKLESILGELKEMMKRDVDEQHSHNLHWNDQATNGNNFYGADMLAIFRGQYNGQSGNGSGKTRREYKALIDLLYEGYRDGDSSKLDRLERIEIPGPNGTTFHILAEPQHYDLFDRDLRSTFKERSAKIEEITEIRERAVEMLRKISERRSSSLFTGDIDFSVLEIDLTAEERRHLEKAAQWLRINEEPLTLDYLYGAQHDPDEESPKDTDLEEVPCNSEIPPF